MKYFKYSEPYYGLVKADNIEQANELYEQVIADGPEAPVEVSEKDALIADLNGYIESDEPITIRELVDEFYDRKPGVLLVDGSLL